jgi:hypothetical protein
MDWGDQCTHSSLHQNDDREDLRIISDSMDQRWSIEDHAKSIRWKAFCPGLDFAHQDDGVAQPMSGC